MYFLVLYVSYVRFRDSILGVKNGCCGQIHTGGSESGLRLIASCLYLYGCPDLSVSIARAQDDRNGLLTAH